MFLMFGRLNAKFERYVREGLKHYSRFADNIVIKHGDKVFLHLMVDQAENDFSREDLPLVTVIREFTNKNRKRFYKFT